MLKRIIASTVMATATHTMRPSRSQRPRKEEVAGGEACALISPTPRPSSLGPSVTTPLYSTTVSQALRQPLRVGVLRELLRTPCMRTSMRRHCLSSRRGGYCLRPSATAALCPSRAMLLSALPVSHTLLGWLCAFDEIRLDSG